MISTRFLGFLLLVAMAVPAQTVRMRMKFGSNTGNVDVQLLPEAAPATVENFLRYMNRGAYNNAMFHRLVAGFVLQTGGYRLSGNSFVEIPADPPVRNEYRISNTRGTIAMAKLGNNPNSATNQFFFNLGDNSSNLDAQNGGFTVFARVADAASQAVIDRIAAQPVVTGLFNPPFDEIPLFNWRGGSVTASNIMVIESMTMLESNPIISANGIVSASAFGGAAAAAAGSYIEIYGNNLADTTRDWSGAFTGDGKAAPTSLDEVSVTVNGVPAFVNFVNPSQVNVQVPEGIPTGVAIPVVVTRKGLASDAGTITIREFAGGILAPPSFKFGDRQYAAAIHANTGKFVSNGALAGIESAPAEKGETILLYGVGFGAVTPNSPSLAGRVAEGLTSLTNPVTIRIGDADAPIAYQGLAPGFVGLYQFNFTVPPNAASGDQPLVITQGGQPIGQQLFISIR